MKNLTKNNSYQDLICQIRSILNDGRKTAILQVDNILVQTYWRIGKYIVNYEQLGHKKAEYGANLLSKISKDLNSKQSRGFSRSNLQYMRQLFIKYPICQTLSGKLSWSHYIELLSISDDSARSFYEKQCTNEDWSVRELKRQRQTALFERIALSKNKRGVIKLSKSGQITQEAKEIIRDPYIFEFLNIKEKISSEKEIENALVSKLEDFILELGKGFAYIGQQYRITLDNTHFYIDLVFYHRILKCFVLIDLKATKATHKDIGQMNMYLNYFKAEQNMEDDNDPIGIVLAKDKDEIMVEYATGSITNQLFVSKYQLYLPKTEELKKELEILLNCNDNIILK